MKEITGGTTDGADAHPAALAWPPVRSLLLLQHLMASRREAEVLNEVHLKSSDGWKGTRIQSTAENPVPGSLLEIFDGFEGYLVPSPVIPPGTCCSSGSFRPSWPGVHSNIHHWASGACLEARRQTVGRMYVTRVATVRCLGENGQDQVFAAIQELGSLPILEGSRVTDVPHMDCPFVKAASVFPELNMA